MRNFIWFLAIFLVVSGCSTPPDNTKKAPPAEIKAETKTKNPVFQYSKKSSYITLNSEPVETEIGFTRVAGIIKGENISALIEIAGRGVSASIGDEVGVYEVSKISEKGEVILCLKK